MYLVSLYFDESSEKRLSKLIGRVAEQTENYFMTEHQVPAHLTLAAFETRDPKDIISSFECFAASCAGSRLKIVSPGVLLPYVIYVTPVMNEELLRLHLGVNAFLEGFPDTKVNRFYKRFYDCNLIFSRAWLLAKDSTNKFIQTPPNTLRV